MPNKLAIVGGMFTAGGIFFDIFNYETHNKFTPFGEMDKIDEKTSFLGFALAGLLVGFGTKLGNGCTSGHGLCGLSRLSIRSFVSVIIFLFSSIGIGTIRYHFGLGPFTSEELSPTISYNHYISANICIGLGVLFPILGTCLEKKFNKQEEEWTSSLRDVMISWVVGLIFGLGLLVAGMTGRYNILSFLWIG